MNRIFAAAFAGAVACTLVSNPIIAQQDHPFGQKQSDDGLTLAFHTVDFLSSAPATMAGRPVTALAVGSKVQRTFGYYFGNRSDVAWSQLAKKTYLAQFDLDGRKTNAVFYHNGFMEYAVSYGVEKNVPKEVRKNVLSVYDDYQVGSTFEIKYKDIETWSDATAWVVNLENDSEIIVARVMGGAVDELNRFNKKLKVKTKKGKVIIP